MFKPTSARDRMNYGEVLMPPPGFRLECAVGTTYSLDLETLAGVSIALGLSEDTDSELVNNRISLLSALQKVSGKMVIFCEAGQIKLPHKMSPLYLILEKMVVPVSMPFDRKLNRYPAFHPKVWLLEYVDSDGRKKYRFVIMSRNMTFDHSWDVACCMDGVSVESGDARTRSVIDFLMFLKRQLNRELANYESQNDALSYMINALSLVRFEKDQEFSDFMILPLGIGSSAYDITGDSLFRDNFHELVVMSPFLSRSVIENLNKEEKALHGAKRTLITRRSELSKLQGGAASNFDIFVMKDEVIDGENSESEDEHIQLEITGADSIESERGEPEQADEANKQDIHAKIYIRRKNDTVDLYLGSMNASYAAIYANVEMMLRLRTRRKVLNGELFLDEIMGSDRDGRTNPFEQVFLEAKVEAEVTSARDLAERLIKSVCRIRMNAEAMKKNDHYDLTITAKIDHDLKGVTIRPLRCNEGNACCIQQTMVFPHLEVLQLSEFYVVAATVEDCRLERVIMIPTSGIPEERDSEIIKHVIRSEKQFFEYVAFILGDDYIQSFLENQRLSGAYGNWGKSDNQAAVYEKMLRTAVSNPEKIEEIQYITRAVEEKEIIPQRFRDMYRVFCETLGIKQE